jgi:hypothetical protein
VDNSQTFAKKALRLFSFSTAASAISRTEKRMVIQIPPLNYPVIAVMPTATLTSSDSPG